MAKHKMVIPELFRFQAIGDEVEGWLVGKSRQSITKSLDAAHFSAIELALSALEHAAAPD